MSAKSAITSHCNKSLRTERSGVKQSHNLANLGVSAVADMKAKLARNAKRECFPEVAMTSI